VSKKVFYGGQAVIEGVMMRAPDRWAVAVRRIDNSVSLYLRNQPALATISKWARWPIVRGNVALYESIALGWNALQISASMAMEDALPDKSTHETSRWMIVLTGLGAFVLAMGLFVLLPTYSVDWLGVGRKAGPVVNNVVEGGVRLAVILAYIIAIGFMRDIRRVFQYHGAEHATINCYEHGEPVTPDNVLRHSVLHPRCGTSFLLTVIVVKLVVNCFLGWPNPWLRGVLRIAVLPLVAALAYEVIYFAGRHRDSLFARAMAVPGMALESLTTRAFSRDQAEVAIHALSAVAPDVPLPADMKPPNLWQPTVEAQSEAAETLAPQSEQAEAERQSAPVGSSADQAEGTQPEPGIA